MKLMKLLATVIALAMASQSGLAEAQTLENLLQQGNRAWTERRYVEAEVAYRQAIALDPKNAAAYLGLGNALSDQKKYVEAEASFRQAIALDPKDAAAYNNLGVALRNRKKYVEAEAAFRQAIALDPKYAAAYYNLGDALEKQKKYVEVEAAYRQVTALDPKYLVKAEASFRQAIALDPKDAAAYYNLGVALRKLKKYEEAEAAFRQAIALDPKDAAAYDNLGIALSNQEKYVEAEASFRQAIALDPKDAAAYNNLGLALGDQKKYVEAEAAFRQAIALDPKLAVVYNNLGFPLNEQKKVVEAEAAFRQAIALDPKYASPYNNLGYVLQQLGRLTDARDLYREAIALDPAFKTARANLEEVERLIGISGGKLQSLSPEVTRYLPQDPLTLVRRSVVRILPTFSGKSSGAGAHGTGFVVRRQGGKAWILTARHVILDPDEAREAVNIEVELYGGNLPSGMLAARLLARRIKIGAGDLDLALLEVDQLPEDIQPLRFASHPMKVGMPLTMVGHPGRDNWKSVAGTFLKTDTTTLLVDCGQMAEGGSGSPVLSNQEEVIGMAYRIIEVEEIKQVLGYSLAKLQATLSQWGQ